MTSNLACNTGSPATSNTLVMTVNPLLPVSVSVSPSANDICEGTSVTFTPDPVNGGTPSYQWFKNSEPVGTGETYSCIPANGDLVYVVMTSSLTCKTGSPATSNTVTMTVNPLLPVSVSIVPDANPADEGTLVTFSALAVNGGTAPSYQWMVNGEASGTDNDVFAYIPVNGDEIICVLTSDEICSTGNPSVSNPVVMEVNTIPSEMALQNLAIDDIRCFNAKQTITVAGNGTVFTVLNGGSATMIAGHSIEYLPGTVVDAGGYLNGFITTNGQYCVKQAAPMVSAVTIEEEVPSSEMNLHMNIYPNPTDGNFTLEFSGIEKSEKTRLNIYGMRGDKIISMDFTGEIKGEFSLSGQPSGIYLIQIISGNGTANSRIIKR
jgi:hypothetical protein